MSESCYFVQVRFPTFAPGGAEGRWVTPAISADARTACGYAPSVLRQTVSPDGETALAVRVTSERDLQRSEGDLAVVRAYRDLRWFCELEARAAGSVHLFGR
jgi:hypothetical protein